MSMPVSNQSEGWILIKSLNMHFGCMCRADKTRVSFCHTLCNVRVHLSKVPCSVECWAKPVYLGALREAIQFWRLGSTHLPLGETLGIGIVKPVYITGKKVYSSMSVCTHGDNRYINNGSKVQETSVNQARM